MKTVRGRFPHSVGEMSAKQTKGDESVRLFLPTGQRAKRGDRSGSSGKKSLRAGQKNTKSFDLVFFYPIQRIALSSRVSVYVISEAVWHHSRWIFFALIYGLHMPQGE